MMKRNTDRTKSRESAWPVAIIAFFAVAVSGCVSFVVFCNLHPADLVSQDYYEQELRYQSQIDRIDRARDIAGQVSVAFDRSRCRITLSLPKEHASAQVNGSIQLYRPSKAGMDERLALKLDPNGTQVIDAKHLSPGLWKVKVLWSVAGHEFFVERKVQIAS